MDISMLNEYLKSNPIPDADIPREEDLNLDSNYMKMINSRTINELAEIVKTEGSNYVTKDGGLGVLPAYARLVKLCLFQEELKEKGVDASDDSTDWYPSWN